MQPEDARNLDVASVIIRAGNYKPIQDYEYNGYKNVRTYRKDFHASKSSIISTDTLEDGFISSHQDDAEDINRDVTYSSPRIGPPVIMRRKRRVKKIREFFEVKDQNEEHKIKPFFNQQSIFRTRGFDPIPINKRPLDKHADTFELENFTKNAMVIFNQNNVYSYEESKFGPRKDVEALSDTFKKFGFVIEVHNDLKKVDIFKELKAFSNKDFTDYGCVVIVVLAHGTDNGLLKAKDEQTYREADIIQHFADLSKTALATKPVVLIIEACRSNEQPQGILVQARGQASDLDGYSEPYNLPLESDMLILHSSYIGKSYLRSTTGSWLIKTLCKKIIELSATLDLESIITEVKKEVAIHRSLFVHPSKDEEEINRQMPVVTSTLTRKLYLRRFGDIPMTVPETSVVTEIVPRCCCFWNHFNYIRNCLRYYVAENPEDSTAKDFLTIATADDGTKFEISEATIKAISNHLENKTKNSQYHKYLYLYDVRKDGRNTKVLQAENRDRFHDYWWNVKDYSVKTFVVSLTTFMLGRLIYDLVKDYEHGLIPAWIHS